jgi:VanZ family protein
LPKLTKEALVRYWVPVVGWGVVIAIESTFLSAARTGSFIDPILHRILPFLSYPQIDHIHEIGRKAGHFIGYGLMSYFFFRAFRGTFHVYHGTENILRTRIVPAGHALFESLWRWRWAALAILGTALVATADEVHQMGDPMRTGSWWDVLLDTVGALVFQLVIVAVIRARTPLQQDMPEAVSS